MMFTRPLLLLMGLLLTSYSATLLASENKNRFQEAQAAYQTKAYSSALSQFLAIKAQLPEDHLSATLEYYLGMSYFNLKNFQQADKHLTNIADEPKWRDLVLYQRAHIALKLKDFDLASSRWEQLLEQSNNSKLIQMTEVHLKNLALLKEKIAAKRRQLEIARKDIAGQQTKQTSNINKNQSENVSKSEKQAAVKRVWLIRAGALHDDNISQLPDIFNRSSNNSASSSSSGSSSNDDNNNQGVRFDLLLFGQSELVNTDHYQFSLNGFLSQKWVHPLPELNNLNLGVGLDWKQRKYPNWKQNVKVRRSEIDGELHSTKYEMAVKYTQKKPQQPTSQWALEAKLAHITPGNRYDYLEGQQFTLKANYQQALGSLFQGASDTTAFGKTVLKVGAEFEENQREDLDLNTQFYSYSPQIFRVMADLSTQLTTQWRLNPSIDWADYRYHGTNRQLDLDGQYYETQRTATKITAQLKVEYQTHPLWKWGVYYRWTDWADHFESYDYRQQQFGLQFDYFGVSR